MARRRSEGTVAFRLVLGRQHGRNRREASTTSEEDK